VSAAFAFEVAAVQTQMAKEGLAASLNGNCLAKRIWWNPAQAIFAAIFEDKLDGRAEALATLFHATTLPVCTGNLRGPGDKPLPIAFNYGGEFVPHDTTIGRNAISDRQKI